MAKVIKVRASKRAKAYTKTINQLTFKFGSGEEIQKKKVKPIVARDPYDVEVENGTMTPYEAELYKSGRYKETLNEQLSKAKNKATVKSLSPKSVKNSSRSWQNFLAK